MGQVNVTYDDSLLTALDRIAGECQLPRPDLLRALAIEAVAAEKDGRLAFTHENTLTDLHSLSEMANKLSQQTVELDRLLRQQNRSDLKLLNKQNAGGKAYVQAQYEVMDIIRQKFRDGVKPFDDALTRRTDELRTAIGEQPRLKPLSPPRRWPQAR